MKKIVLAALITFFCNYSLSAGYRAGVAKKIITPETPVQLSGYASASRAQPVGEVLHDLWAKALVLSEDNREGSMIIIVTMDVIGLSHELSESIIERVTSQYKIDRSQLLINASHTHSGPVIWPSLMNMFDLSKEDIQSLVKYNKRLTEDVLELIGMAISDLRPVKISIAHSSAKFAVNRREKTDRGVVIGVNKNGPVDYDVPVLKIETYDSKLFAVLFGYACHNTTLDINQINGDYAGFAQIEIEKNNPGTVAMFLSGCGADQNPYPRRSVEAAIQHGKDLAEAVQHALKGDFKPVGTPLRTFFTTCELEFAPFVPEQFREEMLGNDRFRFKRGKFILEAMDKGYNVQTIKYPVQAVRFGNDFTIIALAGEVVVDYSLKTKKLYPDEDIFVAGYCTEVQCYIPTAEILKEGGYEPVTSMIYYGLPGPFSENVENKIFTAINLAMKKTGAKAYTRKKLNLLMNNL